MGLLVDRRRLNRTWEFIALAAYAILMAWVAWHHEPWADEAQAWLIARDSTLSELFLKRLHYEGSPGLWHLLLWFMIRAHVSYAAMHWIVVGVGIATAYLVLRYSPFPLWIRLLLPFSFGLASETAVVARSYSLVPILVFAICMALTAKRDRPVLFAVLVGLLANTSLPSAVYSAGFVALYLLRDSAWASKSKVALAGQVPTSRETMSLRKLLPAAAVLLAFWAAAVYTATPAPDVNFGKAPFIIKAHKEFSPVLATLTGIPAPTSSQTHLAKLASVAKVPVKKPRLGAALASLLIAVSIVSIAFFAVSSSSIVAACFYALLFAWLSRRRRLAAALPFAFVLVGGTLLGLTEHHMSLIWSGVIAAAWIGFSAEPPIAIKPWLRRGLAALTVLVLVEQLCWTVLAAHADVDGHFSGSQDAARFIASIDSKPVAGFGFYDVEAQPYFKRSVFFNQPVGYWWWSSTGNPNLSAREVVAQRPQYIVYGESINGNVKWWYQLLPKTSKQDPKDADGIVPYLRAHGYVETHRFCGKQPAHFGFSEETCQDIFELNPAQLVPNTLDRSWASRPQPSTSPHS